jgi:DNA-binding transcriptional LysR family regulator
MELKSPNIRHLRVFLEVVDSKSISKASGRVFLSQPAITQAISKLEYNLSALLFQRRSDGMYVTPSGEALAQRVRRALDLLINGLKGAVRIGGVKGVQPSQLLQLLTSTQLRALVAVSEAQSFSMAGRNLGVSQSSVHRAARELESLLGIVLFEKTSIGISVSKAARLLAKATKLALADIAQGRDEIDSLHNREAPRIVIGSMPLARTSVLPKAIIDFSNSFPDVKIIVNDGPYNDLLYHLLDGDIDFLIGALRFPPPSDDVVQEELFTSTIEIVARPQHPLLSAQSITTNMLSQYSWVVPRKGAPTRAIFESIFVKDNVPLPRSIVETSSQILIRSLLLGSDRLTIISGHQIQHELSQGVLKPVPYELRNTHRPIGITMRASWKPTKAQLSFVNSLRRNGQDMNDAL